MANIPIGSWDSHLPFETEPQFLFIPRPFKNGEPYTFRDQRMMEAIRYLSSLNILQYQQFDLDNNLTLKRITIYAVDGGSSGFNRNQSRQSESNVKHALSMVLLNMNIDPKVFHDTSAIANFPSRMLEEDKSKRLLDIYLDMPSPRTEHDPYMSLDIQPPPPHIQVILSKALRDSITGMKTKLYGYQKNSLWKLLRRELCPDYIIGPSVIPATDMNGNAYYIDMTSGVPNCTIKPLDRWDDITGGIICEDMGLGKSCLCIALIVLTLNQISQPPKTASHIYCESNAFDQPMVLTQDVSVKGDSKGILLSPGSSVPSLRDLAAAAVKMGNIEYKGSTSYDVLELLDSMTIYYHVENSYVSARASRTARFRLIDQPLEVQLSNSTLIIVPPNLSDQWHNEINKHTRDNTIRLLRIESDDKELPDHRTLIQYDIVLIAQHRFAMEYEPGAYSIKHSKASVKPPCGCKEQYITCRCPTPRSISPLMQVRWKRVIVDEGHSMGVKFSDHTLLAEKLHTDRKWICTGTPTFNLANIQQSSSSSSSLTSPLVSPPSARPSNIPISDKGDLDRLGTLITTFLHIRPYYGNKSLFNSALVRPLEEHHNINKNILPNSSVDWSLESLSSVTRLRYLMDRIMIRNKPEDVVKDVSLPPLYERVVSLDLEYFQVLTMNCYVSIIQANAILTEREDQDYFFHPSNRKHLARLTDNLKDGCFWNPAGKDFQDSLRTTLENVSNAIIKHLSRDGGVYPRDDFQFLLKIRDHLTDILSNDEWKVIQRTQEVGYYCENVPRSAQLSHALILGRETRDDNMQDLTDICIMLGTQISQLRTESRDLQINNSLQPTSQSVENNQQNIIELNSDLEEDHHQDHSHSIANNQPIIIDLDLVSEEQHYQGHSYSTNNQPTVIDLDPEQHSQGCSHWTANNQPNVVDLDPAPEEQYPKGHIHSTVNNQPIIIDLDPDLEERNSQDLLGTLNTSDEATRSHVQENNIEMSIEHLSKSTINCSTSSKLNYIVSQILRHKNSEKCIIFCQGQTTMYYINEYLALAKVRCLMYHTYGMSTRERSSNIMTFNTSENVSAIIMDVRSGAHGIDLSSASRVYFVSPVWRADTMRQAVKRAHRIGQTRPVYVETLIIDGSIEEAILNRRNEIDSGIDSELTPEPGSSLSVATQMPRSRGPKKDILDDGGVMRFIHNINFMTVPTHKRLSEMGTRDASHELSLSDSWNLSRHIYLNEEDRAAFIEDDSRYEHTGSQDLSIPIASFERNSVRPSIPLSDVHDTVANELRGGDQNQFFKSMSIDIDNTPTKSIERTDISDIGSDDIQSRMMIDDYHRENTESEVLVDEPKERFSYIKNERRFEPPSSTASNPNILEKLDALALSNIHESEIKQKGQLLHIHNEVESKQIKIQPRIGSPSIIAAESRRPTKTEISPYLMKPDPCGIFANSEPEYYVLYDEDVNEETHHKVESKDEILARIHFDNIRLRTETKDFGTGNNKHLYSDSKPHYREENKHDIIQKHEDKANISMHIQANLGSFDVRSDLIGVANSNNSSVLLKRCSNIDRGNSEEYGEKLEEGSDCISGSKSKRVRFG